MSGITGFTALRQCRREGGEAGGAGVCVRRADALVLPPSRHKGAVVMKLSRVPQRGRHCSRFLCIFQPTKFEL